MKLGEGKIRNGGIKFKSGKKR